MLRLSAPAYRAFLFALPDRECYRILAEPGHDRAREILEATAFYPPVTICAAGLLYFLFPAVPLTAQAGMLGFVALGAVSVFLLGRRLNLRYTLPILPAAALVAAAGARALPPTLRHAVTGACIALGALQVSMTAFALPAPPTLPGFGLPMVFIRPPRRPTGSRRESRATSSARVAAGR